MQNRTYGDLYKLIQSLCGVLKFAPQEEDDIANFINRRLNSAYNASQAWPRYLVTGEERRVSSFTASGVSPTGYLSAFFAGNYYLYGKESNGNPVYLEMNKTPGTGSINTQAFRKLTDGRWICQGGTFSKDVGTNVVTYTAFSALAIQRDADLRYDNVWDVVWQQIDSQSLLQLEQDQLVPFDDILDIYTNSDPVISRNTINEFIKIHKTKPMYNRSAVEYDFYVDKDGAHILNMSPNSDKVFVTYKKALDLFTTNSNYKDSTEEVPQEFFAYLAHATYADFLTMDGQTSKAIIEQDRANELLTHELEKVDIISNNQFPVTKFSTYVNRQAR
jgi:hypothetical protein